MRRLAEDCSHQQEIPVTPPGGATKIQPEVVAELLADELIRACLKIGESLWPEEESYLVSEMASRLVKEAARRQRVEVLPSRTAPRLGTSRRAQACRIARDAFRRIGERDGFACRHCGTGRSLTVDHIVAVVNGGSDEDENFQILCASCNSKKSDR